MPVFKTNLLKEGAPNTFDKETGCYIFSDDYYECKQAFFAEKQAKILEQSVNDKIPSTNNSPQTLQPLNNYSNYQQIITDLQTENEQLAKKLDEEVSQNSVCALKTERILDYYSNTESQNCLIDAKTLFIQNIFSYRNLPLLIAIILIALLFIFKRKFKTTK